MHMINLLHSSNYYGVTGTVCLCVPSSKHIYGSLTYILHGSMFLSREFSKKVVKKPLIFMELFIFLLFLCYYSIVALTL